MSSSWQSSKFDFRVDYIGIPSPRHAIFHAIAHAAVKQELPRPGSPAQPGKIVTAHHSGMTLLALAHALLGLSQTYSSRSA